MSDCPRCYKYYYHTGDHCCTVFQFRHENYGDEWQDRFFKGTLAEFAEDVAENDYSNDPCDPCSFEYEVEVRHEKYGAKKFHVSAEVRVTFSASEVKP